MGGLFLKLKVPIRRLTFTAVVSRNNFKVIFNVHWFILILLCHYSTQEINWSLYVLYEFTNSKIKNFMAYLFFIIFEMGIQKSKSGKMSENFLVDLDSYQLAVKCLRN